MCAVRGLPVVGSSRRRQDGEVSSSAAMATRRLSPPDKPLVNSSPIKLLATYAHKHRHMLYTKQATTGRYSDSSSTEGPCSCLCLALHSSIPTAQKRYIHLHFGAICTGHTSLLKLFAVCLQLTSVALLMFLFVAVCLQLTSVVHSNMQHYLRTSDLIQPQQLSIIALSYGRPEPQADPKKRDRVQKYDSPFAGLAAVSAAAPAPAALRCALLAGAAGLLETCTTLHSALPRCMRCSGTAFTKPTASIKALPILHKGTRHKNPDPEIPHRSLALACKQPNKIHQQGNNHGVHHQLFQLQ